MAKLYLYLSAISVGFETFPSNIGCTTPMSDVSLAEESPAPVTQARISEHWQWRIGLALLTLFTGWLYLWRLATGARSEYYAAIAVSMSKSFSNFIFGSLDPAGTVSLDKIPGSYWIPALFVKVFGFSTWAVDAPNALAGIGVAIFIAMAVRRYFGIYAGLFAGALIATTPIIAAVARSNQPQTFFLLALAISADRATAALKSGNRRSLIWTGVWIGIAFQTYMLEAWAVWPALIVAWLVVAPVAMKERIKTLLIAGVSSLAVSLSWIIIVTMTPASSRPYVGGTYHNSAWEMVFGYNGLGRFSATQSLSSATDNPIFRSFTPPFSGTSGFARLFNNQVAGQISWLIPTSVIAILVLSFATFRKPEYRFARGGFIFIALWFITFYLMFAKVAGMHQFYTTSLAIPMAFLISGSMKFLIERRELFFKIVLSLLLLGSAIWMSMVSGRYQGFYGWSPYVAFGLAAIAIFFLFIVRNGAMKSLLALAIAGSLLTTPTVWAADVKNRANSINPTAGPNSEGAGFGAPGGARPAGVPGLALGNPPTIGPRPNGNFDPRNFRDPNHHDQFPGGARGGFGGAGGGFGQSADKTLIAYLKLHREGTKYLLATFGGMSAAPFITATGENVLPIGGFDGQDPSPTLERFKELIKSGDLKYVLVGGMGSGNNGNGANTSIIETWVTANCQIDSSAPSNSSIYLCTPEVAVNN